MNIINQSTQALVNIVYFNDTLHDLLERAQETTDHDDRKMLCDACLALLSHEYDFNFMQEEAVINEFMAPCE